MRARGGGGRREHSSPQGARALHGRRGDGEWGSSAALRARVASRARPRVAPHALRAVVGDAVDANCLQRGAEGRRQRARAKAHDLHVHAGVAGGRGARTEVGEGGAGLGDAAERLDELVDLVDAHERARALRRRDRRGQVVRQREVAIDPVLRELGKDRGVGGAAELGRRRVQPLRRHDVDPVLIGPHDSEAHARGARGIEEALLEAAHEQRVRAFRRVGPPAGGKRGGARVRARVVWG